MWSLLCTCTCKTASHVCHQFSSCCHATSNTFPRPRTAHTCTHTHTCMHTLTHTLSHTHSHTCTLTHAHTHKHTHVHMHTCTHKYTADGGFLPSTLSLQQVPDSSSEHQVQADDWRRVFWRCKVGGVVSTGLLGWFFYLGQNQGLKIIKESVK